MQHVYSKLLNLYNSNGLQPTSDGLQSRSNGHQPKQVQHVVEHGAKRLTWAFSTVPLQMVSFVTGLRNGSLHHVHTMLHRETC